MMTNTTGAANDTTKPAALYVPQTTKFRGAKYDENLDVAEIAKRIRADIKADKSLPKGLKVRVRISRYSMGQSIALTWEMTGEWTLHNPARLAWDAENPHGYSGHAPEEAKARYSVTSRILSEKLEAIANAYQDSESDIHTDYHNCNFHLSVGVASAWEDERRAVEMAKAPTLPAPAVENAQESYLMTIGAL